MALGALITGAASIGSAVSRLATGGPSEGLLAVLGEGVDEFGVRVGGVGAQLSFLFSDANTWVGVAALTATAVTVVSAFRQVSEWIHGPSDAGALVQHAAERAGDAIGVRPTRISWGTVHDEQTGEPLPFARVGIHDAQGSVIARAIADVRGRYGFHLSADAMNERGGIGGMSASKDGYHEHTVTHPVLAGLSGRPGDIPMKRRAWFSDVTTQQPSGLSRRLSSVAFWTGVGSIPAVYLAGPTISGAVLIALFTVSAMVRAVGSVRNRDTAI